MERLAVMDLEPLELRRIKKSDLTMHFKIYNNMSALPSNYVSHATIQYKLIMRPSSLGGGRILRHTLSVRPSVCLSVCPSVPLADVLCLQLHRLLRANIQNRKTSVFAYGPARHVCTFRHAQRAAYRTAISAAQILVIHGRNVVI